MLDLALGHAFEYRSLGEYVSGLSRVDTQMCSCGLPMLECSQWSSAINGEFDEGKEFREYAALAVRLARIASIWRVLLLPFSGKLRALLAREAGMMTRLADVSSAEGYIDSSKELTRALLSAFGPSRASWVHLVRNPLDVAISARQRVKRGVPIKINRRLFYINKSLFPLLDAMMLCTWFVWTFVTFCIGKSLLRGRYALVIYEEFTRDPDGGAEAVARSLRLRPPSRKLACATVPVTHIVGGNRMAKAGGFQVSSSQSHEKGGITSLLAWLGPLPLYYAIRLMRSK